MPHYVYILRCSDNTYYTGVSGDPQARELAHNTRARVAYTWERRPVRLVYQESHPDLASARQRENQIKHWSHEKKTALIEGRLGNHADEPPSPSQPDPDALRALANARMPFGKHKGTFLTDLPEAYLIWFARVGLPKGKLGEFMRSALEIKTNGLESLVEPFRDPLTQRDRQTDRERLLEAGRWFLNKARGLDGVLQIALIGSLCTPKPNPKDIDLLVWIRHGLDLAPLAGAGRALMGQIQRGSLGADVFLVEDGRYIGRTCRYRDPWPRVVCAQARNLCASGRPHLCDTSANFTLRQAVIDHPPLILWPGIHFQTLLPADLVAAFSLQPFMPQHLF